MENTLKVFISSTSDLRRWRSTAMKAIEELSMEGVRFEDWSASPQSPLEECLSKVRQSDAFVLLVGNKYGTVVNGLSITHHEYRAAKICIPVFVFFLPRAESLEKATQDFLAEVQNVTDGYFRKSVKNTKQLKEEIKRSLAAELTRRFRVGNIAPENLINDNKHIISKVDSTDSVPNNPTELFEYLRQKYDSGQDEFIVGLYDLLSSIQNIDMNILNFCFMSEINLGLDNFGINSDHIRRAIAAWTRSLNSLPSEHLSSMHYNIGNGYNVLGDLAKAISHYQSSLNLHAENPECLKNYGSILMKLGRKREAVELFERALQSNPRHSQSLFSLAVYQIREQQNFEKGIELLSMISIRNTL